MKEKFPSALARDSRHLVYPPPSKAVPRLNLGLGKDGRDGQFLGELNWQIEKEMLVLLAD